MKQSITTLILAFFFCVGLAAQGQIGISFYRTADLYTVEQDPERQFFVSGYELLKPKREILDPGIVDRNWLKRLGGVKGFSMDLSYLRLLKSNQTLRVDLTISPLYNNYCFNAFEGGRCRRSGADTPINVKLAYLKSFRVAKKLNVFIGTGMGMRFFLNPRYSDVDRRITGGGFGSSRSTVNGEVIYESNSEHVEFTNRLTLYLPAYFGFEYQLTESISIFYEMQGHFNLFKPMRYLEFDLESINYPGEAIQSTVMYGNYLMGGLGVRYILQQEDLIK